jgi:MFS family permease
MSTSAAAPIESRTPLLTQRQILTIFGGLMLGMFLAALDQTIVATSIRTIADDLDGLSLQAWATTAYLITATISTPGIASGARPKTTMARSPRPPVGTSAGVPAGGPSGVVSVLKLRSHSLNSRSAPSARRTR